MSKEQIIEEDANEVVADMAEAIVRVADAGEALLKSGLTKDAIIVLIQQKVGVANIRKSDVENVLWALPKLRDYLA